MPTETFQPDLWQEAGREPSLSDVFADPTVHAVMARDGLTLADLGNAITVARHGLMTRKDVTALSEAA